MATVITTAAQLAAISSNLAGDYELGNDILNYDGFAPIGGIFYEYAPGDWRYGPPFTGSLDGKGYTISGAFGVYESNHGGYIFPQTGIFGVTENAIIQNIVFEDCSITYNAASAHYIFDLALVVGYAKHTTFSHLQFKNCSINITNPPSIRTDIGLCVGFSDDGDYSLISSEDDCSITYPGDAECGMLIGGLEAHAFNSTIYQCSAKGTITTGESGSGCVGGLVGYLWSLHGYTMTVSNSYSQVDLTMRTGGGFCGGDYGDLNPVTFTNCYASGSITGVGESQYLHGFVWDDGWGDATTSCYWRSNCFLVGSDEGEGIANPTSEANMKLQATYSGWNFTTIWGISGGYPYLLWAAEAIATTIETLAAKNVFDRSATIGGEYTAGDATHVEMGIQWRPKGLNSWVTYWWAQSPYYIAWSLVFWYTLSGLGPGRTYEYRAFYKIGTTYTYGSTLEFTTTTIPAVFNYPGTEYRTAKQAIDDVAKIGLGRYYADAQGNFQYESRLRRMA